MTITLRDDYFSGVDHTTSPSRILVQALKASGSDAAARKTTKHFTKFMEGLSNLSHVNSPTRNEVILLWHAHYLELAEQKIKPIFERHDIPFVEYVNILQYQVRRMREHGALLWKLRS